MKTSSQIMVGSSGHGRNNSSIGFQSSGIYRPTTAAAITTTDNSHKPGERGKILDLNSLNVGDLLLYQSYGPQSRSKQTAAKGHQRQSSLVMMSQTASSFKKNTLNKSYQNYTSIVNGKPTTDMVVPTSRNRSGSQTKTSQTGLSTKKGQLFSPNRTSYKAAQQIASTSQSGVYCQSGVTSSTNQKSQQLRSTSSNAAKHRPTRTQLIGSNGMNFD